MAEKQNLTTEITPINRDEIRKKENDSSRSSSGRARHGGKPTKLR